MCVWCVCVWKQTSLKMWRFSFCHTSNRTKNNKKQAILHRHVASRRNCYQATYIFSFPCVAVILSFYGAHLLLVFFCCCCCCCWCCWASSALSRSISIETQSKASFFAVVMLRCRGRVPFSNPLRESTPCNQESLAVRDITSVASSPTLVSGFARMWAALQLVGWECCGGNLIGRFVRPPQQPLAPELPFEPSDYGLVM